MTDGNSQAIAKHLDERDEHEGPLVDWVHKILTGFETINRNTLAELKGEADAE